MGRKVVLEHPDGRRLSADEDDLDDPRANPFNYPSTLVSFDADTGTSAPDQQRPGRPLDDHQSLSAEGFEIVGWIDPATGHERRE